MLDGARYFTGCLRDVTTQKAAIAERENLLERLTHSNAELERFAMWPPTTCRSRCA